jgi:hypothetical protein
MTYLSVFLVILAKFSRYWTYFLGQRSKYFKFVLFGHYYSFFKAKNSLKFVLWPRKLFIIFLICLPKNKDQIFFNLTSSSIPKKNTRPNILKNCGHVFLFSYIQFETKLKQRKVLNWVSI